MRQDFGALENMIERLHLKFFHFVVSLSYMVILHDFKTLTAERYGKQNIYYFISKLGRQSYTGSRLYISFL